MVCYRKTKQYIAARRAYKPPKSSIVAKLKYWKSSRGRAVWRRVGNRIELRKAIKILGYVPPVTKSSLDLYMYLKKLVLKNIKRSRKVLKGGLPDSVGTSVEFKIGIDYIRANQLILNILEKERFKIRWAKTWEDIENVLKGFKNTTILFKSYLDYILVCESSEDLNLRVSAKPN